MARKNNYKQYLYFQIETATGKFPYEEGCMFKSRSMILNDPSPTLSENEFSPTFCDFISQW